MSIMSAERSGPRLRIFVENAVKVISSQLVSNLKLAEDDALEIARNMTHDLCEMHGGDYMYVPKDVEFQMTKRDQVIYERFNGRNLHQLVKEFGITHTRIYQIVAQMKKVEFARRQRCLPGIDD